MSEDQGSEATVHTLLRVFLFITFEGKKHDLFQKKAATKLMLDTSCTKIRGIHFIQSRAGT